MKATDIECTTIECILPWVMRNWAGCKKFGVVGYTSSHIDLVCTTTGYTRPISQLLGASSDMDLVHTATGYASKDIDLGSWVQNHWEHRVYCLGYRVVGYVSILHSFWLW